MLSTGAGGAMAFFFLGPKPQSLPPLGDGGGGSSLCLRPFEHRDAGPQHGIGMCRLCESTPRGKRESRARVATLSDEMRLRRSRRGGIRVRPPAIRSGLAYVFCRQFSNSPGGPSFMPPASRRVFSWTSRSRSGRGTARAANAGTNEWVENGGVQKRETYFRQVISASSEPLHQLTRLRRQFGHQPGGGLLPDEPHALARPHRHEIGVALLDGRLSQVA